jgi:hypothetical protein
MSKLEKMVTFLWEASASRGPVQGPTGIIDFLQNNVRRNIITNLWQTNYPGVVFCNESEFKTLVNISYYAKSRTTQDSKYFPTITSHFPLLDLIALLYPIAIDSGTHKENDAQQKFDEWVDRVNNSPKQPLAYTSLDFWPELVKDNFLGVNGNKIGEARLEQLSPELGFYQTILTILKMRKDFVLLELPQNKKLQWSNECDKIILDFIDILGINPPDIKIKELERLYGSGVASELIAVMSSIYALYKQQISLYVPDQAKAKQLLLDKTVYKQFIGYPNLTPINWQTL